MAANPLILSSNYVAVVRAIRELHQLNLAGLNESPEADAVRDAADSAWAALTESERQRASGLSEDLYSISDPPRESPAGSQFQTSFNEALEARRRGEWDRALQLLREANGCAAPALVSDLRGAIWLEAGDAETAALFFEHARALQRDGLARKSRT
jgi:hypothetical protein